MTSLSNKLLLTQPNTNTDHTTKKSGFTSFHDNLNNEFKLGSFQTKNNVTVLAPAHRVMGPSQYGGGAARRLAASCQRFPQGYFINGL